MRQAKTAALRGLTALIFLLAASRLQGTMPPTPLPPPTNWVGYGVGYSQGKAQVTLSYASQLSSKAGIWTYTSADYLKPTGSPVVSSLRTGLFVVIRQAKGFTLGETFQAGGSTGLNKGSIDGTVAAGALAMYRFKSGLTISIDTHAVRTANNGTTAVYTLLMGKAW